MVLASERRLYPKVKLIRKVLYFVQSTFLPIFFMASSLTKASLFSPAANGALEIEFAQPTFHSKFISPK